MPEPTKIEIRNIRLETLLVDMESKGIPRIPRFQRDYVWERSKVAELFDSIYREFPIGSFFFWITPREYRDLYKDIPELHLPKPADYEQIKMILDGQQRITSLYVAAKGLAIQANGRSEKDYKKICFDLDAQNFFVAKRSEDKKRVVSVWRFFDRQGDREVYDDLTMERRESFRKCQSRLLSYPLSIVEVREVHLGDAVKIFERINQGGKRLGLFDLVVASTWSTDFDLKEKVRALNKTLEEKGFGKIDEEVVAQLISLDVKGQCTRAVQLQLKNEEIKAIWDKIEDGIKLAVDFLSANLGVRIYEFVPYPSMIAMVAYLFVKAGTRSLSPQQAAFVKEWFWKAAFSQRYSASTLTLMGSDRIDYFDPAVGGKVVTPNYHVTLTPQDLESLMIHTRSAVKNAILCLLALRIPRHFKNGSVISLDKKICSEYNSPEKHHIFPKAVLARLHVKHRHLLANFAFIPGELNREISASKPSEYFSEFKEENAHFDEVLESHLIPQGPDSPIWKDDYEAFVKARTDSIFREIEKVVGTISPLEVELENDPVAVMDRLEAETRRYIDGVLTERIGEKYWDAIPQGIRESVEKRQAERLRRHPYERNDAVASYERLTFCDIMDYAQIILKNWEHFEGVFGSRGEVERHFLNLKEYRNALKHARAMNTVERKQGEASVEWLFRILERARESDSALAESVSTTDIGGANGQSETATRNDESKKPLAKTNTEQSKLTPTKLYQFELWNKFKEFAQAHSQNLSFTKTYPQHWYNFAIGSSSCHVALTVVTRAREFGCELYIPHDKELFDFLLAKKDEIEKELGIKLDWQRLPEGTKASRIKIAKKFDIVSNADFSKYGEVFAWLENNVDNFKKVFSKHLADYK